MNTCWLSDLKLTEVKFCPHSPDVSLLLRWFPPLPPPPLFFSFFPSLFFTSCHSLSSSSVASDPARTSALLKTFLNTLRCSSSPLFSHVTSACRLASTSLPAEVLEVLSSSRSTFSSSSSTAFSKIHRSLPSPLSSGRLPAEWRRSWRSLAGTSLLLLLVLPGSQSSCRRSEEAGWSADGTSSLPPGTRRSQTLVWEDKLEHDTETVVCCSFSQLPLDVLMTPKEPEAVQTSLEQTRQKFT